MNPNPRIHRPSARSYVSNYSSVPTITQSSALWKAMRHREEMEKHREELEAGAAAGGLVARLRHVIGGLPFFRERI